MTPFEDDTSNEKGTDSGRLLALSDGVFAVAITLLVLTIQVPDFPPTRSLMTLNTQLLQCLLALWPPVSLGGIQDPGWPSFSMRSVWLSPV